MLLPEAYRKWSNAGGFWGGIADYFARSRRASSTVYKSPYTDEEVADVDDKDRRGLAFEFYNSLREEDRAKIDAVRNGSGCESGSGRER